MKKFLMIVGGISLSLLLFVGSSIGLLAYRSHRLDADSKQFANVAAKAIATGWAPKELESRISSEFKALLHDGDVERYFQKLGTLGRAKNINDCDGESGIRWDAKDQRLVTASYTCSATFEGGTGEIKFLLILHDTWQIAGFRVDSPLLGDQKEANEDAPQKSGR